MLRRHFSGLSDLGNKKNAVAIILICNAFVWYYTVLSLMQSSVENVFLWAPVHFSALIVSAFAGASYARRMERSRFLTLWMIMGVVSSVMLFGLDSTSPTVVSLVSLFSGLSLGFGMPACMSYFTDNVPIESRGRVSGIIMLASGIGIVAFGSAPVDDLLLIGIVLGIFRFSSLVVFLWVKDYRKIERKASESSFKQVFSQRSFILYFLPWVMFSLVNYLAMPATASSSFEMVTVQTVFMGGAAVLGGFLLDSGGRKPIAIAGFAMLGLGTAVLGFLGSIPLVLYFTAMIDGVALGFLFVLFVLTLWGDLSHSSSSDKYYALGVMPFFVSKLLELTVGPNISVDYTTLFSFTAVFLFLAVLPLFYAPETLPEKVMKERELKFYVEQAQEIAQKYY
jgi:MFS family permease